VKTALNLTHRQIGIIATIITALCWSFLAIFLKLALKYSDSYTIIWYRMIVPFVFLFLWFLIKKNKRDLNVLKVKFDLLLIAALALAFNYIGFMQGVHYTSPANAQIFIQLGPLLLALSGLFFFNEKLNSTQILGLLLCLFGFAFFFIDRIKNIHGNDHYYTGLLWIFSGTVTWAIFASIQKKLLFRLKSSQINIFIYMISSFIFAPMVNWQNLLSLPWYIHLFFIFLGLNTLVAYGCLSVALKYLPATQVSPIITMNPLLTLVLIELIAWMNWNFIPYDPISLNGYIGAICAITGIIFVLSKKKLKI
jgi:drug/metabolite transporter (DMT)-like permease